LLSFGGWKHARHELVGWVGQSATAGAPATVCSVASASFAPLLARAEPFEQESTSTAH